MVKIKEETHIDDICQHILNGIQKYYIGLERIVYRVWNSRKSVRHGFANQFDLKSFMPLNCDENT
jgi:hypothetical protein